MTPVPPTQPPAAPEGEVSAWVAELTEAHRDSYPMGNIHHGTPERPDWGTFCVECRESWPCDVSRLLDRLRVVEGERDAARSMHEHSAQSARDFWQRAESAEAALAGLRAGLEALADDFASNVDWSNGRSNYGDNEAWESAARQVRALLGGAS